MLLSLRVTLIEIPGVVGKANAVVYIAAPEKMIGMAFYEAPRSRTILTAVGLLADLATMNWKSWPLLFRLAHLLVVVVSSVRSVVKFKGVTNDWCNRWFLTMGLEVFLPS